VLGSNVAGTRKLIHKKGVAGNWDVYSSRLITGLKNGVYTFRAWGQRGGGESAFNQCNLIVKDHGGADRSVRVTESGDLQLYEINDVIVTNGQARIGLYTKVTNGLDWHFVYLDAVEFFAVNLLNNPGFEVDAAGAQSISGWTTTAPGSGASADKTSNYSVAWKGGKHLEQVVGQTGNWEVFTNQLVTGIPNGTYTVSARVKKGGAGFNFANLVAMDHGGTAINAALPSTPGTSADSRWLYVEIPRIAVSNNQCRIGFNTKVSNGTGWPYVYIDDVRFTPDKVP
jgi:endo-chitodextinase